MVEPLGGTMEGKDLLVARTMTCGGEVVPVEVLNPTAEDVFLYKDTHVGVASPVIEVTDVGALSQTDEGLDMWLGGPQRKHRGSYRTVWRKWFKGPSFR